MKYTDLIFDLYGTLVDIHTEETDEVWKKVAVFFGFYGAHYSGSELHEAFQKILKSREAKAGQDYECFPDIPFEPIMSELFRKKGVKKQLKKLGIQAAQLFRILSIDYIRLYPDVPEALSTLKANGYRLWLLSNAQRVFTEYELRHLELDQYFDGIYLSSDYSCRKPDLRFFKALIDEHQLDPAKCLMIGNDRNTDIAGAKQAGLATLYMHTNLTPSDQKEADLSLSPDKTTPDCRHYEYEGWDWTVLTKKITAL